MSTILRVALIAILMGASSASAQAEMGKLGIIGDSIALATHADDDCRALDVYECLEEKLQKPDPAYSFAGGDQPWSLRTLLDFAGVVDASRNGARWRDAPQQALEVMLDAEVRAVIVLMGSNDVCRPLGRSPPPLANVVALIDETLGHLIGELPAGGVVYVAGLLDIVHMRDLMVARDHNPIFKSCQALWDLDFSRVKNSAIEGVCEHYFGSVCNRSITSFLLEQSFDALAFVYERLDGNGVLGVEGSCGSILHSASDSEDRRAARRFNIELNDLIMRKAQKYSGRDGVRVRFLSGLFEEQILVEDVSSIDCFHPSRVGQRHIAQVLGAPIVARRRAMQNLPAILDTLLTHDD